MTPEHTKQQLQDQLRSGEIYGLNLVTNLHERTRKLIFKNDQHCQRCDTSPAVETPSMTAYQWDGKGEDPNAPLVLCIQCAAEYQEIMEDQWNSYYSGLL